MRHLFTAECGNGVPYGSRVRLTPLGRSLKASPLAGSFATSLLILGVNMVTGVLLARTLGPSGRGELAAILLWPALLVILGSIGVTDSITYHAARQTVPIETIVGTVALVWVVQTIAIVAVGAVFIPQVMSQYGSQTTHLAVLYLTIYTPLFLALDYILGLLKGIHRFGGFQALRLGLIVITGVGLVLTFELGVLEVGVAVGTYATAYAAIGLVALVVLRRTCPQAPVFDSRFARTLIGFAVKSHTSSVSSFFNERLDQLVIAVFLAPAQLGLYVIAVTLTSLTNLVGYSVSAIALPVVAAERAERVQADAVRRYIRLTLLGAIAITVPMLLLAPALIDVFFGSSFAPAASVTRVLLIAAAVLTITRLVQALLKAAGRPLDAGVSEFVAVGVTLVSLAVLLPWLGILGAGVASLLAYCASAGWTAKRASRAFGLSSVRFLLLTPGAGHSPASALEARTRDMEAKGASDGEDR